MSQPFGFQFSMPVMPVPLSACFVNVAKNGRADTERYTAYKKIIDTDLRQNHEQHLGTPYNPKFSEPVTVRYDIRRPDKRKRDLDNLLKALNDTLTRNYILKDDSQIVDLRIKWNDAQKEPVVVTIYTHMKEAA